MHIAGQELLNLDFSLYVVGNWRLFLPTSCSDDDSDGCDDGDGDGGNYGNDGDDVEGGSGQAPGPAT